MREYWRKNQILIAILLAIWALVSYGFTIFGARALYSIKIGSLPMSFWWAQCSSTPCDLSTGSSCESSACSPIRRRCRAASEPPARTSASRATEPTTPWPTPWQRPSSFSP
jgi:putative solute:sodium symporter small subunit